MPTFLALQNVLGYHGIGDYPIMTNSFADNHPIKGLLRIALRFPVYLYRLHMGWLLGSRFLLLTTTGRKSGLPRGVVVEVVSHNKTTDTFCIASGWGDKSDWFRNIQKNPNVNVTVGVKRLIAIASEIPPVEAEQMLYNYTSQHPITSRFLTRLLVGERLQDTIEQSRSLAH
jgi:deazaflavin-dependent oxidoreductase (nitroreductase family)